VAAFYYLRIVKMMYFDPSAEPFDRQGGAVRAVLAVSGLVMLFAVVYPAPFTGAIAAAAHSLF
jgi:NADH-quinone oxidoreductase subunit N